MRFQIRTLVLNGGRCPFDEWLSVLDGSVQVRIDARIARFEEGNFGDHKSVGSGVIEARFFFGSAYRVYFSIQETEIVLLLIGGDKSSQLEDINKAKKFLNMYLEVQSANKKS